MTIIHPRRSRPPCGHVWSMITQCFKALLVRCLFRPDAGHWFLMFFVKNRFSANNLQFSNSHAHEAVFAPQVKGWVEMTNDGDGWIANLVWPRGCDGGAVIQCGVVCGGCQGVWPPRWICSRK